MAASTPSTKVACERGNHGCHRRSLVLRSGATGPGPRRSRRIPTLPKLRQHRPQEGFSRLSRRTLLYSRPHSTACCRGWQLWPGFRNRKGDHSRISSVRPVEAANSSSEVVVSQADSLVGGGVSVDRLDRLLHKHCYQRFLVGSVDSFLGVICRHVPTVCGSLLEAQSVHAQAPILPVGTLVPLPPLWHFNGAGILALRNQQSFLSFLSQSEHACRCWKYSSNRYELRRSACE